MMVCQLVAANHHISEVEKNANWSSIKRARFVPFPGGGRRLNRSNERVESSSRLDDQNKIGGTNSSIAQYQQYLGRGRSSDLL